MLFFLWRVDKCLFNLDKAKLTNQKRKKMLLPKWSLVNHCIYLYKYDSDLQGQLRGYVKKKYKLGMLYCAKFSSPLLTVLLSIIGYDSMDGGHSLISYLVNPRHLSRSLIVSVGLTYTSWLGLSTTLWSSWVLTVSGLVLLLFLLSCGLTWLWKCHKLCKLSPSLVYFTSCTPGVGDSYPSLGQP